MTRKEPRMYIDIYAKHILAATAEKGNCSIALPANEIPGISNAQVGIDWRDVLHPYPRITYVAYDHKLKRNRTYDSKLYPKELIDPIIAANDIGKKEALVKALPRKGYFRVWADDTLSTPDPAKKYERKESPVKAMAEVAAHTEIKPRRKRGPNRTMDRYKAV